mgnify:CR=1 FL=1
MRKRLYSDGRKEEGRGSGAMRGSYTHARDHGILWKGYVLYVVLRFRSSFLPSVSTPSCPTI